MKTIDISTWNRKEHYEYFSTFDDPMFGIVSEVDCTHAYNISKEKGCSFFGYYLHRSMLAVDAVEELKYRILDGQVVMYDEIHAGPTIGRDDGTFGFSYLPFIRDYSEFCTELKKEISAVQNSEGLRKSVDGTRLNIVYYSTLPWSTFTGLKHPFLATQNNGIPKITFGKMFRREKRMIMNIAVHAHHGLVDGAHVANYLDYYQNLLNE